MLQLEQSATRDSGLLLTFDIPKGDQVSPFSSVIHKTFLVSSDNQFGFKKGVGCDYAIRTIRGIVDYSTLTNSKMVQGRASYNGGTIESHTWSIERRHFQ